MCSKWIDPWYSVHTVEHRGAAVSDRGQLWAPAARRQRDTAAGFIHIMNKQQPPRQRQNTVLGCERGRLPAETGKEVVTAKVDVVLTWGGVTWTHFINNPTNIQCTFCVLHTWQL